MEAADIVWEAYDGNTLATLPAICMEGMHIWMAVVPLICFNIGELHQPDRVMRRFLMAQHIPKPPSQLKWVHNLTLRGKTGQDWYETMAPLIDIWNNRLGWVQPHIPQQGELNTQSEYMRWYQAHTRRWISRKNALQGILADGLERVNYLVTPEGSRPMRLEEIRSETERMIMAVGSQHRFVTPIREAPADLQPQAHPMVPMTISRFSGETGGLEQHRVPVQGQQFYPPQFPERDPGTFYFPPPYPYTPFQPPQTYFYPDLPPSHQSTGPSMEPEFTSTDPSMHAGPSGTHTSPIMHQGTSYSPGGSSMAQDSSQMYYTPMPYTPSGCTPSASQRWISQLEDTPMRSPEFGATGIDLNIDFQDVMELGDDVGNDESQQEIRRNPHRQARDRGFRCILSPMQPDEYPHQHP